ncbi:DEAD-domain-containing protein [Hypoxylon sp. NC1633]|nr:DEAD-domain-containing protein [Hypoxylon sp. NC1633]
MRNRLLWLFQPKPVCFQYKLTLASPYFTYFRPFPHISHLHTSSSRLNYTRRDLRSINVDMEKEESTGHRRTRGRGRGKGKKVHTDISEEPISHSQSSKNNRNNEQDRYSAPSTSGTAPNTSAGISQGAPNVPTPTDAPTFAELSKDNLVHPVLLKTIVEDLKFDRMMPVQAATIYPLLRDRSDVLAQAKTGTGKTVAFLLPAIQKMIEQKTKLRNNVSLLVISPTRELAMQIANEARALLQNLRQYRVCIAIGGTNKLAEEKRILQGCDILIGTPGRLYDHLSEGEGQVVSMLQNLDTLVLDEADRLLDMGFLDSLKKIIRCLPDRATRQRQSMLFSATIAQHVQKVSNLVLSKDYKFISTIAEGELNTHERVPQQLIVVPTFSDMAAALVSALRQELAVVGNGEFKSIVFAPAARLVDFYTHIIQNSPGFTNVAALHSRMTQSKRGKITEDFRRAQSSILVATDVIARGMDFPSVTNVFQVGLPSDRESYVHRLGRTARAGAEGRGTFIITAHETFFTKWTLKDIQFEETPADLSSHEDVMKIAMNLDPDIQQKAYQGWLGYYKPYLKQMQWDAPRLVQEANKFALNGLGAPSVPALTKKTVGMMGLRGAKGLVIAPDPLKHGRGGGGDSEGNFGNAQASSHSQRNKRPRNGGRFADDSPTR